MAIGGLLLGGCVTPKEFFQQSNVPVADAIPENKINTEPRRLAADGIRYLDDGNLEEALKAFNKALSVDAANSALNFFAALTYHLMALQGADAKFALARHGYARAAKLDRSNWYAFYFAGLLELDLRNYQGAQNFFAEALIFNSKDPDLLYNMAAASYYAGDIPMAEGVLRQLRQLEPESERVQRASAISFAALGDFQSANHFAEKGAVSRPESNAQQNLAARLVDWRRFHNRNRALLASVEKGPSPAAEPGWQDTDGKIPGKPEAAPVGEVETEKIDGETSEEDTEAEPEEPEIDENQMIIVDVVIIRTEEKNETAKGLNLLNNLTLEFGSSSSSPGYQAKDSVSKTVGNITRTITRAITIPSITYSINIANASDTRNEILARPTLTAMNGEPSDFFSGVHIQTSSLPSTAGGTGDGFKFEDQVGVTLQITPEVLEDGRVKIAVSAERTFLNTPDTALEGFTAKLEKSQTKVNATVAMNFNDTLILSGLSEKEVEKTSQGVPFLQELPGIQYLFSRKTSTDFNRSVLILITPRQPEYVYRKGVTDAPRPGENTALTEFRARYSDWFRPYPNWASVFNHMQENSLYREFRTGDVTLERWESNAALSTRLKRALGFLYY